MGVDSKKRNASPFHKKVAREINKLLLVKKCDINKIIAFYKQLVFDVFATNKYTTSDFVTGVKLGSNYAFPERNAVHNAYEKIKLIGESKV